MWENLRREVLAHQANGSRESLLGIQEDTCDFG